MYRKLTLSIIILFLITSCADHKDNTDLPTIRSNTNNKATLSELFDEITVVPLETNASGLLGLTAFRIEVFQDKIFILNQLSSHKNILCFHSSGKFLFAVDKLGMGPGEYTYLGDFFIDPKRECLILCSEGRYFYRFDLSGQYLTKIQSNDSFFDRQSCYFNDSTVLVFNDQSVLPEKVDLLTINLNTFDIEKTSDSRSILSGILAPRLPLSISSERVLFYDATDTIFDVTDISNRIIKYSVDFGRAHRNSLKIISQSIQNLSYNEIMERWLNLFIDKQLISFPALFENDHFLVIGYAENSTPAKEVKMKYSFLLHDKENQQTYNSGNIAFDVLNLPDMGNFNILGKYNNAFYALFTPDWSSQNMEKLLQSKKLTEELKRYFREGDEENNPLLVMFK